MPSLEGDLCESAQERETSMRESRDQIRCWSVAPRDWSVDRTSGRLAKDGEKKIDDLIVSRDPARSCAWPLRDQYYWRNQQRARSWFFPQPVAGLLLPLESHHQQHLRHFAPLSTMPRSAFRIDRYFSLSRCGFPSRWLSGDFAHYSFMQSRRAPVKVLIWLFMVYVAGCCCYILKNWNRNVHIKNYIYIYNTFFLLRRNTKTGLHTK